jgi:NitT/TauT family transport system ATP-binding protein
VLRVEHLKKSYGEGPEAVHAIGEISFETRANELVCIVGPSGCGKTTLLKCISGLLTPTAGEVWLDDDRVLGPPERMALVFQEYSRSLFPWMTVRQNVAFPLRRRKLGAQERAGLVAEAVESVGLTAAIDRYRGSSRAACSSGWRSPGRSPTSRRSCLWTSRSPRWTRRPAPTSRT